MLQCGRLMISKDPRSVLRKKFLNLLRSQKGEDRLTKSRAIAKKLFSTKEFQEAKTILFYASFDGEVETFNMMKQARKLGKRIALPKILENQRLFVPVLVEDLENDLVDGPYGIKQPNETLTDMVRLEDIDLVLVPGVAFDRHNNRLGRGAGYYDRFLSDLPSQIPTLGLAFDFQVIAILPHQREHDVAVSRVILN